MKACARLAEAKQVVGGHSWSQACTTELREHIAQCVQCSEAFRMQSAFLISRESASLRVPFQCPERLFWKAQLRRRQIALEQLQRPALTIIAATVSASAVLLIAVFVAVTHQVNLPRLVAAASSTWGAWTLGTVAVLLTGLATIAVLAGAGSSTLR